MTPAAAPPRPRAEPAPAAPDPPARQDAWISIWPRGGAKSTHAELAVVYLGSRNTVDDDRHRALEADYEAWLYTLFADYMGLSSHGSPVALAEHHHEFWRWVISLAAPRHYGLYVSDTQDQADDHVANIADMLTGSTFARWYPKMAARRLTKFGHSAGWKRNRLRTAAGFTVDAIGLDSAARGLKMEADRPDIEVLDDLDRENDSPNVTERKKRNLTRSIIQAQGPSCAVMGVQNLILRGGLFDQLATGTADFLYNRKVSGPFPALRGFDAGRDLVGQPDGKWRIRTLAEHGVPPPEPTWAGMDLARCQKLLDDAGRESFLVECQHSLGELSDLVFGGFAPELHEYRFKELPEFVAYFGGEDFGGEGLTAHNSALGLLGMTRNGRLILLDEWYDNGENVDERQIEQQLAWQGQYGPIRWCQDGDERTVFQRNRRLGFDTRLADHKGGSLEHRVRKFGRRLAKDGSGRPGFYYTTDCTRFRLEASRWRRGPPPQRKIIPVDDDVLMAVLYAVERAELDMDTLVGKGQTVVIKR